VQFVGLSSTFEWGLGGGERNEKLAVEFCRTAWWRQHGMCMRRHVITL